LIETFALKSAADTGPNTTGTIAAGQRFAHTLRRVLVAWLVGFFLSMAVVVVTDPDFLWGATFISIASGLVAVAALGPVAWLAKSSQESVFTDKSCSPHDQQGFGVPDRVASTEANWVPLASALMSGVMLRLAGTVALFLLCRYQMGHQPSVIAAWVTTWYLWLASVEVSSLAKSVPAPLTK